MRNEAATPAEQDSQARADLVHRVSALERRPTPLPGNVPAVRAAHAAGTDTVPTATPTAIPWTGAETFDSQGFHSTSSNPSRFTVPAGIGGLYEVGYSYVLPATAAGVCDGWVTVNGAGTFAPSHGQHSSGSVVRLNGTDLLVLAAGDIVEVVVQHSAGSTLAGGGSTDHARLSWVGAWS